MKECVNRILMTHFQLKQQGNQYNQFDLGLYIVVKISKHLAKLENGYQKFAICQLRVITLESKFELDPCIAIKNIVKYISNDLHKQTLSY